MVKTFKKLVALTAAVALVSSFAVCASAAVTVNTTTAYKDASGEKVIVTTVVSDGEGTELDNAQVTYYATNAAATATDEVVYIDQKPATDGSATFTFETDADYVGSGYKVSYTGAAAAIGGNTIPDAPALTEYCNITVTGPNGSASTTFEKNTAPNGQHTVAYTPTAGKYVSALQVTGGDVAIVDAEGGNLIFTLSNFAATSTDITITVTESFNKTGNEIGGVVNAGGLVAGENSNDKLEGGSDVDAAFQAATGDRKLTVIGKVENLAADATYGVIVTAEAITAGEVATLPAARVYAAKGKSANGYFAVQLIDTNADAVNTDFIKAGVPYNTAVYYKTGNTYKIIAGEPVTIAAN